MPVRTRSRVGALIAVAAVALGGCGDSDRPPATPMLHFHSRPDLRPDALTVTVPAHHTAPGYVFVAVKRGPGQDGPMILDDDGRVVWFHPVPAGLTATGFRVQRYRGEPVLTWWQGHTHQGHGSGEYVILDRHYRVVARVHAGDGLEGDHHEFQLTPQGTAYLTAYAPRPMDLRAVGGPRHGTIYDSVVQEVDVASGRLLWQWRASDHVPLAEGVTHPKPGIPHDYFHVNAVDVERDGDLLISARNTSTIYEVSRRTGAILWRLGGKRSDFAFGPGARFAFQHDAERRANGTISLFDNEATPPQAPQSRGLVLRLDPPRRTATLVRTYTHPDHLLVVAEGNVQTLPDGDVFIGWGAQRHVSELSPAGRLLFDLELPKGSDTYQAFRSRWDGEPLDRPAVAAKRTGAGRLTVWASWNGATAVRRWQVLAGPRPGALVPVGAPVARHGFETAIAMRSRGRYLAVQALDGAGRTLGTSYETSL